MKKVMLILAVLFIAVISTACINNFAVQELNNKAKTFMDQGDYDSAINRLQSSIDLDGTIFETHYNLGIAYVKAEQYSNAIIELNKTLQLNPKFYDAYYSLAIAQDNYAGKLLNKQTTTDEDNPEVCKTQTPKEDDADKALSPAQKKEKALGLYQDAIESYTTYLSNAKNIEDRADIESQVKDIEEEIQKIGK